MLWFHCLLIHFCLFCGALWSAKFYFYIIELMSNSLLFSVLFRKELFLLQGPGIFPVFSVSLLSCFRSFY